MKAEMVSTAVNHNADMVLVGGRVLQTGEIGSALAAIPASEYCALVVVGCPGETEPVVTYWVDQRDNLVALGVAIVGDLVRIAVRNPGLDSLLTAIRDLVNRSGLSSQNRISRLQLPRAIALPEREKAVLSDRPLLHEAIIWIARLGGFLARKHDGQPGTIPLWRGWKRLTDLTQGWRLATGSVTCG